MSVKRLFCHEAIIRFNILFVLGSFLIVSNFGVEVITFTFRLS